MKSQFLMMQGNKKEALKCYQRFIVIRDSLRTTSFYRSLKSLDTQRQSDQLQLKNKQLQLETSQYHYRMMTMKYDFAILIVVCIIMVIVIFFARRISIESKKAQLKAEEADRMKSAFLANINHEIRTPLNAIVGFSQLIVDEKDPEVRKQYSEIILDNNERLQRLIGDVLDLSKIESNSVKLSFSNVELLPLLEGIYHSNLSNMPVDVELQMQPCDDFTLYTDGSRLAQIITCLLNYAIQHTHKGYIRIGYQTTANQVQFFVEDTGDGIAEDKISTIFEHSTQLNRWNNTDLSLAISKGLTLLLGGEISLKSTLGKGSTFYVTLFTNFVTLPTNKKEENHHE
jgi:signal transduction histidine kinase